MTTGVEHRRAGVGELHRLEPWQAGDGRPAVWWCDPTDAAVVLGSRQTPDVLDTAACAAAGLSVVRRRSGGGAVLVEPGRVAWIDLVVPHGVAPDDIRGSMQWAGARWRSALATVAPVIADRLTVHGGGMIDSDWSALVCFAGVGPGELLLDGRKLVGLSQRRTRHGLRVQGMLAVSPPSLAIETLFAGALPAGRPPAAAVLDVAAPALAAALATLL